MAVPTAFGVMAAASAGGGGAVTTWNPADRATGITLSGGNLIATVTGAGISDRLVRSTTSKTAGKWHFEITVNANGLPGRPDIGIANAAESLAAGALGDSADSIGYYGVANGSVIYNSVSVGSLPTFGPGDTVAIELDADGDLVYFQKLGQARSAGFSVAGISGAYFAALGLFQTGDECSVNFGQTAFLVAVTGGYSAWG
jgi:hypothetical protein